jgi:hypothetical protein
MEEGVDIVSLSLIASALQSAHTSMVMAVQDLETMEDDFRTQLRNWISDTQQQLIKFYVLIKWISKASRQSTAVSVSLNCLLSLLKIFFEEFIENFKSF